MCKHLKYDEQGSSASKSEPNDSIGNEAEREAPQVSQEKEAVESDQTVTVGCEQISSNTVFYSKIGGQYIGGFQAICMRVVS